MQPRKRKYKIVTRLNDTEETQSGKDYFRFCNDIVRGKRVYRKNSWNQQKDEVHRFELFWNGYTTISKIQQHFLIKER